MERLINTPEVAPITQETSTPDEMTGKLAEISRIQLQGFFGLNDATPAESKMLSEITNMIGKQDAELLWEIRNIENRIGVPPIGMSRLQHVYNFFTISNQIKKLESQRDAYMT